MNTLEEFERRLHSSEEAERIYAAEDGADANDPAAVETLLRRLAEEPSRAVRGAIFGALEAIEGEAVIRAALELLSSQDAFLRNESVELLRRKGPGVIPALDLAFSRCGSGERKLILDVMSSLDAPGAESLYARALADEDVNVVITAVENIGKAGHARFRGNLERLFDPEQPMLAAACLEALAVTGGASSLAAVEERLAGAPPPAVLLPSYLELLAAHGGERAGCAGHAGATPGGEAEPREGEGCAS